MLAEFPLLMLLNAPVPNLAYKSLECKFVRSEAETERFCVLTLNMKRLLLETPVRVTMRIQIRLPRVRAKGKPTHTKRPTPMMMMVVVLILTR
jgi:hypothetical protein